MLLFRSSPEITNIPSKLIDIHNHYLKSDKDMVQRRRFLKIGSSESRIASDSHVFHPIGMK
jgi:hypothetical protein